jgi:hypothetical protein
MILFIRFPLTDEPGGISFPVMLRQGCLRRQRNKPAGLLSQQYCVTICAAREV